MQRAGAGYTRRIILERVDRRGLDLLGQEVPGCTEAEAVLLCRPFVEGPAAALIGLMAMLPQLADTLISIGNLLGWRREQYHEEAAKNVAAEALQAMIALLVRGALVTR